MVAIADGTETYNYITGNLGILIRRSSALLLSDMKPAIFWTASATNFWYDNVAVHSFMFGVWFELAHNVARNGGDDDEGRMNLLMTSNMHFI